MIAAIITAAGSGLRLGLGDPKAQRMVRGLPLFVYSLRTLCANQLIDHIVAVSYTHLTLPTILRV